MKSSNGEPGKDANSPAAASGITSATSDIGLLLGKN
jgi:hypothetical protein